MTPTAQDRDQTPRRPRPQQRAAARAQPRVSLHFLDDESVLFDGATRHIYAINTAATLIWCCLEEGMKPDAIAARLAESGGMSREAATKHVAAMLEQWHALGLIGERAAKSADAPAGGAALFAPLPHAPLSPAALGKMPSGGAIRGRILDMELEIRFSTFAWREKLDPMLVALSMSGPSNDIALPAVVIELAGDTKALSWLVNGESVARCATPSEVAPLLKSTLVELALRTSRDFGAVHAAAIGRAGRCVVLPGQSGVGKSTLTAAMCAAGYEFLGDDTLVLDRARLAARPLPFPICVKAGAGRVLAPFFPALAAEPVHLRADGKRVRYLHATFGVVAQPGAHYEVAGVVFPRWAREAEPKLIRVARPQALQALLAGFCPLGEGLSAADVDRLVAWLGALDCYELQFSALDDAIAQLANLLP